MKMDNERVMRVKSIAHEMIADLLTDATTFGEQELRQTVELLTRTVQDFTNLYLEIEADHETTLKATISKMRLAQNTLKSGKRKQRVENESVLDKKV